MTKCVEFYVQHRMVDEFLKQKDALKKSWLVNHFFHEIILIRAQLMEPEITFICNFS